MLRSLMRRDVDALPAHRLNGQGMHLRHLGSSARDVSGRQQRAQEAFRHLRARAVVRAEEEDPHALREAPPAGVLKSPQVPEERDYAVVVGRRARMNALANFPSALASATRGSIPGAGQELSRVLHRVDPPRLNFRLLEASALAELFQIFALVERHPRRNPPRASTLRRTSSGYGAADHDVGNGKPPSRLEDPERLTENAVLVGSTN